MRKFKQGIFALLILSIVAFVGACASTDKEDSSTPHSPSWEASSDLDSELSSIEESPLLSEEESSIDVSEEVTSEETSEDSSTSSSQESVEEESDDGRFELPEDDL